MMLVRYALPPCARRLALSFYQAMVFETAEDACDLLSTKFTTTICEMEKVLTKLHRKVEEKILNCYEEEIEEDTTG